MMLTNTPVLFVASALLMSQTVLAALPFTDPHPGVKDDADITYYLPGEPGPLAGKGACGIQNHVTDRIVAISKGYWDKIGAQTGTLANGNNNPLCNKKIEITTPKGKEIATITDRCGDCEREDSVDVTPVLAEKLIGPDYLTLGRVKAGISWRFVDDKAAPPAGATTAAGAPPPPAASPVPPVASPVPPPAPAPAPAPAAPPKRSLREMVKRSQEFHY